MSTVRRVTDRLDELEGNGFENRQARVLAMAIDETVEDRLEGVIAPVLVRLDNIDSQIKGINSRLDSRKYETAVITATFGAALIGIGIAVYEYVVKPMVG